MRLPAWMITQAHFSIRSCLKEKNPPILSLTHLVPHREKCLNQMHCLAHCEQLQFSLAKQFRVAFRLSEWDTNVKDVSVVYFNWKTRKLSTEHGSSSTIYNFQQEIRIGKQMQLPYAFTGWPAVPNIVLCGKWFHFCKQNSVGWRRDLCHYAVLPTQSWLQRQGCSSLCREGNVLTATNTFS